MNYSKISFYAVLLLIICILLIAFFCIVAFSSSYGYSPEGDRASAAMSTVPRSDNVTIIIDAGHGGIDPGAVANNLVEKDLNLSIALKLKDFLSISGYNVITTRSSDTALAKANASSRYKKEDLNQRIKLAEDTENAIFISIHMNKFESPTASGLQTFYSANNDESLKFANCVQDSSKILEPNNKREVKQDNGDIYILDNISKPSILVECGFLSNKSDAEKLKDEEYQNKLAFSIYTGIINYLGGK